MEKKKERKFIEKKSTPLYGYSLSAWMLPSLSYINTPDMFFWTGIEGAYLKEDETFL